MNTFLFAFNAVAPIVLMIALGWALKKAGLFTEQFLTVGNRVVFRVLLSVMTFNNIYKINDLGEIDFGFVGYALAAVTLICALAFAVYLPFTKDNAQRGALIQSMFRSNFTIIGLPLSMALFGDAGGSAASVLSAFIVPLFNVLAVVVLAVFAPSGSEKKKIDVKKIVIGIVTNPLIIAAAAGMLTLVIRRLLVIGGISFRLSDVDFIYKPIKDISACATPLALLILGGRFEFSAVRSLAKPIVLGTVMRTVVTPALALTASFFLMPNLTGAHYAAYIAAFASPVAVSSAVMAKEMESDATLADQLVVWTSIVSMFTVFAITVVFREIGIF